VLLNCYRILVPYYYFCEGCSFIISK